jgi:hypothetical protein
MLPVEADPDFQSSLDYPIDQEIARLEEQIERLTSLKGSGPEIATVIERVQEVFGERCDLVDPAKSGSAGDPSRSDQAR